LGFFKFCFILYDADLIGSSILKLLLNLFCIFLTFERDVEFFIYFVNVAAASPWLRRSWSRNYSVLVVNVKVYTGNKSAAIYAQFFVQLIVIFCCAIRNGDKIASVTSSSIYFQGLLAEVTKLNF
jgi:hypothetical protein